MSDSTIINIIATVLAIMVLVLGTGLFLLVKELKWQKACIESQDYRLQDLERLEELRIVSSEPAESSRTSSTHFRCTRTIPPRGRDRAIAHRCKSHCARTSGPKFQAKWLMTSEFVVLRSCSAEEAAAADRPQTVKAIRGIKWKKNN